MSYMLDQAGDSTERERLALLQRYYDAETIPKLQKLDVAPGWRCHDVGADAGSIAQWLSERVGRVAPFLRSTLTSICSNHSLGTVKYLSETYLR